MDQAEHPEEIHGRPDLTLRIKGVVAPGQETTTTELNDLLREVGAALNYLFEQGLEQTRISDTVKKTPPRCLARLIRRKTFRSRFRCP